MAQVFSFEGMIPVIDPTAFVHPTAVLIGDVIIGPRCYVGPGASLRGDFGRIVMGEGANLQDNCVVHSFPGKEVAIGADGHIGHGAVLHGCTVAANAFVGMSAVVMDSAEIGENAFVGAMSLVKAATVVPANMLVAGSPATVRRPLSEQELTWKRMATTHYQDLARRCLEGLAPAEPLPAVEPDRRRAGNDSTVTPLHERKSKG